MLETHITPTFPQERIEQNEPRKWLGKGVRALAFWMGLGLLLSIQSYLVWPNVTFAAAIQATMPRW